ncbi:hypothetical protein CEH05_09880 [Halobacillus halophilus]|nr:hypothetical protein CEH05_09880 [Halobacillus halophilus]
MVWGFTQLFGIAVNIHFIHIYGILFAIEVIIMLTFAYFKPRTKAFKFYNSPKINMTPWK